MSFWRFRTPTITLCHLCLLLLPLPFLSHIPVPLAYMHLSSLLLYFSFRYLFLFCAPPQPSSAPRHPGQLFVQTGCLQLSVRSGVAVQEAACVACGAKLFPNTSVSSEGSIRDPSVTSTPPQPRKPPTHTSRRCRLHRRKKHANGATRDRLRIN